MIAPYRHVRDWEQLTEQEFNEIFNEAKKMTRYLKRLLKPDGFNIGMNMGQLSGAAFGHHLHLHIVPRWKNDTNYMPVINNTKVISQSLEELYTNLMGLMRR